MLHKQLQEVPSTYAGNLSSLVQSLRLDQTRYRLQNPSSARPRRYNAENPPRLRRHRPTRRLRHRLRDLRPLMIKAIRKPRPVQSTRPDPAVARQFHRQSRLPMSWNPRSCGMRDVHTIQEPLHQIARTHLGKSHHGRRPYGQHGLPHRELPPACRQDAARLVPENGPF
jgi:hypothetical protein